MPDSSVCSNAAWNARGPTSGTFFREDVSMAFFPLHYANMSVQYTAIFHGCKNGNFQMKKCEIFLIFAQNIDRGYALEPPQRGGSNEYPRSMF